MVTGHALKHKPKFPQGHKHLKPDEPYTKHDLYHLIFRQYKIVAFCSLPPLEFF